jgi:hypothetical protein
MKKSKLAKLLSFKLLLVIALMLSSVAALVVYTAGVLVTPTEQYTIGSTTSSWSMYINEVDVTRYLPGAAAKPTFNSGDTGTYAFKVVTDPQKVCAVKIELTSAMNSSKFSKYQITVESWTGSAWATETLYAASTGATTKTFINGLTLGDAGYIHQAASATKYYLVTVTYSYDLVGETTQVSSTFQYTPLPQDSF